MNADGSGAQKITALDRDPGGIVWARDGSGVYFSVGDAGTSNVYFAAGDGRRATAVTTGTHMVGASSISRTRHRRRRCEQLHRAAERRADRPHAAAARRT